MLHNGPRNYSCVHLVPFNVKTHVFASGKFSYINFLGHSTPFHSNFFLLYFFRTLISEYISYLLMCKKSRQNLVAKNTIAICYAHSICGQGVLTAQYVLVYLISAPWCLGLSWRTHFHLAHSQDQQDNAAKSLSLHRAA